MKANDKIILYQSVENDKDYQISQGKKIEWLKTVKLLTFLREINTLTTFIVTASMHGLVLNMARIGGLSNFIRIVSKYKLVNKPGFFKVSKIDLSYTGKSGFISIKAPAIRRQSKPEPA